MKGTPMAKDNKMNRLIGIASFLALAASSTAGFANPVGWTAPGGNLSGQYCYDFGGYIPSVDSPVIGGWTPY